MIMSCFARTCHLKNNCKTFEREKVSGQLIHHFAPHPQGEHCEFFRRRARDFDPSRIMDSGAVGAAAGA